MTPRVPTKATASTPAARARAKTARVVRDAGAPGHIVDGVPDHSFRTDLAQPVLRFVVYGIPAPQGSKAFKGFRGGKPVLKEQSDGLAPWREAVRAMARKAIQDHTSRTGKPWRALDEPVLVTATVTVPTSSAATARGDVYATGTPDLDKLQRGIGDALAPSPLSPSDGKGLPDAQRKKVRDEMMRQRRAVSVLHDDSRIVAWEHVRKVYPSTTPDSLGYPGVTIQVWRVRDLEVARRKPVRQEGNDQFMSAQDLRDWSRPLSGRSWDQESVHLWQDPVAVFAATGETVVLRGRGITEQGARAVLRALALFGADALVRVEDEPVER